MKKNKTNEIKTDNIISDKILMPVIIPMNPEAITYLGWFLTDTNNLSNWSRQLFCNDVDLRNPKFEELKKAAESSIKEIEDDLTNIKNFLEIYKSPPE